MTEKSQNLSLTFFFDGSNPSTKISVFPFRLVLSDKLLKIERIHSGNESQPNFITNFFYFFLLFPQAKAFV